MCECHAQAEIDAATTASVAAIDDDYFESDFVETSPAVTVITSPPAYSEVVSERNKDSK